MLAHFSLIAICFSLLFDIGNDEVNALQPLTGFCSGAYHNCIVLNYSQLKCLGMKKSFGASKWNGDNIGSEPDELGDNLPTIDVGSNAIITQVVCGDSHTCVKLTNGYMKCLGDNNGGQTGIGNSTTPIGSWNGYIGDKIPVLDFGVGLKVLDIVLGRLHSCVLLTGNKVKCFGNNQSGQLGYGDKVSRGTSALQMGDGLPFIDFGNDTEVSSIHSSASANMNCVILSAPVASAERAKCWGSGAFSLLGYNDTRSRGDNPDEMGDNLPLLDFGSESRVKQFAFGFYHTCVLIFTYDMKCFGRLEFSSASTPGIIYTAISTQIVPIDPGKTIMSVSSGRYHSCILYDDMVTLKCFGSNDFGQLGQEDKNPRGNISAISITTIPKINLGTGPLTISSIHAGTQFNCVKFADLTVRCFGDNSNGQFGVLSNENRIGDEIDEMGNNLRETILEGTYAALPTLPFVNMPIISFCCGGAFACAVFNNKKMKCWGSKLALGQSSVSGDNVGDDPDELGDNLPFIDFGSSVLIEKVSCGNQYFCAQLDSGDLKCIGRNIEGQAGVNNTINFIGEVSGYVGDSLPIVNFGNGLNVIDFTLGAYHACIKVVGNKLKCFGWNIYGMLGLGDTVSRGNSSSTMGDNLPFVDLGTGVEVASVHSAPGAGHSCIILAAPIQFIQRIKCWGISNYYQLGYGALFENKTNVGGEEGQMGDNLPFVDLGTESRVKQIAVGTIHTCALLINDDFKCWGHGAAGSLASGSESIMSLTGNSLPSILIDPGKTIKNLVAGEQYTCILYDDQVTAKCTGIGMLGSLGQGDGDKRGDKPSTIIPLIPKINFGTGSLKIASVHSGVYFNCVIFVDSSVKCFGHNSRGQLANGKVSIFGADFSTGEKMKFAKLFSFATPTKSPTDSPTKTRRPSVTPTDSPTDSPTKTRRPSYTPTISPTKVPALPTKSPTSSTESTTPTPTKSSSTKLRLTCIYYMMMIFILHLIKYNMYIC